MSTTIQSVASELSSTPRDGQPWNFNGVLEAYLIPRVIARDTKLLPGARLLWGVIRQHSWRDGRCTLSDESLARAVGVAWRQSIRYCRQLERSGLLRTTPRPGRTPVRELLWDARFAGKLRKPPALEDSPHCLPGQPPLSLKADLLIGSRLSSGGIQVKRADDKKGVTPEAPALATRKPARVMTEEEYRARGRAQGWPEHVIERDLERFRERRRNASAERMVKADELKPELEATIRR